jgi:hypothetical protein
MDGSEHAIEILSIIQKIVAHYGVLTVNKARTGGSSKDLVIE